MDTKGKMREGSALGDKGGGQSCKGDEDTVLKYDGSMQEPTINAIWAT